MSPLTFFNNSRADINHLALVLGVSAGMLVLSSPVATAAGLLDSQRG